MPHTSDAYISDVYEQFGGVRKICAKLRLSSYICARNCFQALRENEQCLRNLSHSSELH